MVIAQASSPALVEVQVCSVDVERDAPRQLDGSAGQVCSPERLACFVVLAVPQEQVLPQDGFPAPVLPRLPAVPQVSRAVPPQPVSLPEQAAQLASQQVSPLRPVEPPVRVGLPEQPPQAWAVIPGLRARTPQASRPLPQQHG